MAEKQKKSLEDFKKSVEDFLLNKWHYSTEVVQELMKDYERILPKYWEDGWEVETAATAMSRGF